MARPRTSLRFRLVLLLVATAVAFGFGEIAIRLLWNDRPIGELFYQDAQRQAAVGLKEGIKRGIVVLVDPAENPRGRYRWAPDSTFYLCYRDQARLRRDWLDEQGCVEVRTNHWGLRERDEIAPDNKVDGEQRIVCVGDSFTFGWGIPVEQCWVRLLENELRRTGRNVRTVNCGAAGALVVDEYWWAFQHRFAAFQPDAVIVTLCLNDLLPSSGLCLIGPKPASTGSHLVDRVRGLFLPSPLDLDPTVDWVGLLLATPEADLFAGGLVGHDNPYAAMWSQQAPQGALRQFRDWCAPRGVPFLVVLWPFLQGLGDGVPYPFARIHQLVGEFCRAEGIAFLDLLPALRKRRADVWWVTPADMHANPAAHLEALPVITNFVRKTCGY